MIHQTAIVDPGANLGPDVEVGPFSIIEKGVTIGAGSKIAAHVVVRAGTVLEEEVQVDSFTVIGGLPQDLSFDPLVLSGVRIGRRTVVREHVTIHRSTCAGGFTQIGEHCMLMAASHVGHDSTVADRVILANNVMLAGHVHVGSFTFLGGGAGVHQHCRIGEGAMISGLSRISRDVPPFCLAAERNRLSGLNLIGLRRRKFTPEAIREIKEGFHSVYDGPGNRKKRAEERLAHGVLHPPTQCFLEFFRDGKRFFVEREGAE